jgi:hypothetical protein
MAIDTRGTLRAVLSGRRNDSDDFGGGLSVEGSVDLVFGNGNASGQIDRVYQADVSIAAGFGMITTLDLLTVATKPDATLAAGNVRGIWMEADANNSLATIIQPGATDGWTALLGAEGVFLAPGAGILFWSADGYGTLAADKTLDFVNQSGAEAIVKVVILAGT